MKEIIKILDIPEYFTRTGYCKNCEEKEMPKLHTVYFVFGGTTRGWTKKLHIGSNYDKGVTPHVFSVAYKIPGSNQYLVKSACAVIGCGIEERFDTNSNMLTFKEVKNQAISTEGLVGLYENKGFGLELNDTPIDNFKADKIQKEQEALYEENKIESKNRRNP